MDRLDTSLQRKEAWQTHLIAAHRRIPIDLDEVERVLEVARRVPELAAHESALGQLSVFMEIAGEHCREVEPQAMPALRGYWERLRAAVVQRRAAVTPMTLREADRLVGDILERFLLAVPGHHIAYSRSALPLTWAGEDGPALRFTHPPAWNRPLAVVGVPHSAFDQVWRWLSLVHRTGHDVVDSVSGLDGEVRDALEGRMRCAVLDGEISLPEVDLDLSPLGTAHRIRYQDEDLLAALWCAWAREMQADVVGLLACGAAATATLQRAVGFSADSGWQLVSQEDGVADAPLPRPPPWLRNAFHIAALRRIGDGHVELARELEARFHALRPRADHVVWRLGGAVEVVRVPLAEMEHSAEIAADLLVLDKRAALGFQSFADVGNFSSDDQALVDEVATRLAVGDPTFAQLAGVSPRHAVAAALFALEQHPGQAAVVDRTFKHFL